MKITKLKLGTLIGLLVCSLSANATIIDNGSYTTDTITGLDWLDLTVSVGLSINQVLDSNQYIGWHYANADQYRQLIFDFTGLIVPTLYEGVNVSSVNLPPTQASYIIQTLGSTYDSYIQQQYGVSTADIYLAQQTGIVGSHWHFTFGFLDPNNYINIHLAGVGDYNPNYENPLVVISYASVGNTNPSVYSRDTAFLNIGSFLIRDSLPAISDVPEPTTIAFLATGLLGLGLSRRKSIKSKYI